MTWGGRGGTLLCAERGPTSLSLLCTLNSHQYRW